MNIEFSKPVSQFISDYSEAARVDPGVFVEHCLVDLMARIAVQEQAGEPVLLPYLTRVDDDELLTGYPLFSFLFGQYRSQHLLSIPAKPRTPEELEHILEADKRRCEESDQMKAEQAAGRIPQGITCSPHTALSWLKLFDDGQIDQAGLDALWEAQRTLGGYPGDRTEADSE
ncbi:MAG: hypothetical protein KAV42_01180 [Candidatus Krumholzibacteria bacterium]|nr:hypothetical protein [Candidatus Krumholzibacteria bacterium]